MISHNSTVYTNIPHNKLLESIKFVLDETFKIKNIDPDDDKELLLLIAT